MAERACSCVRDDDHCRVFNAMCPIHSKPREQHATLPIGDVCSGCGHQAQEIRRLHREIAEQKETIARLWVLKEEIADFKKRLFLVESMVARIG